MSFMISKSNALFSRLNPITSALGLFVFVLLSSLILSALTYEFLTGGVPEELLITALVVSSLISLPLILISVLTIQFVKKLYSEQRRLYGELKINQDHLCAALDNMAEGIALYDADDRLVMFNEQYADSNSGIRDRLKIGITYQDVFNKIADAREAEGLLNVGKDIWVNEHLERHEVSGINNDYQLQDGTWIRASEHREKDKSTVVLLSNVTQYRELEASLRSAIDDAKKASQAKSEFLAKMSHEIRTPMNGVIGMADLLSRTDLEDRQQKFVQTIKVSANSLLNVINDVLDFSKIDAGQLELQKETFLLQSIVDDVVQMLKPLADSKGHELSYDITSVVPKTVVGDPGRVRQILVNLLGNAVKFTDAGNVSVDVSLDSYDSKSTIIRFQVIDSGIGISPKDQKKLFRAFEQADNSSTRRHGGTGLGLAISRELATLMDGEIGVRSELGRGSTFWFTAKFERAVPSRKEETKLPGSGLEMPGPFIGQSNTTMALRVLVAEDNPVNQLVIEEHLRGLRCDVDIVENGKQAIQAFESVAYDLVFMDVQMPELDGLLATKTIRQTEKLSSNRRRVPVIALTAEAMQGDREKCLAAGMDDYVSKPIDGDDLCAVLRKWSPDEEGGGKMTPSPIAGPRASKV